MAFASMLRRSAASAAPLAIRFAGRSRQHTSAALLSAIKHHGGAPRQNLCRRFFPSALRYSTATAKASSSDEKLLRILESEIDCAEEPEEAADVPADFPFKIEDVPGEQIVKLTRQYEGEAIEVEVYMPDLDAGDGGEYDDDKSDGDSENSQPPVLTLVVKVSKDFGPSLEFSCSATTDEVQIDGLSMKNPESSDGLAYDGPDFGDLDENLQKAFHKYLNVRGITPVTVSFLHEYMINKDSREYKMWLQNLRKFVEA